MLRVNSYPLIQFISVADFAAGSAVRENGRTVKEKKEAKEKEKIRYRFFHMHVASLITCGLTRS